MSCFRFLLVPFFCTQCYVQANNYQDLVEIGLIQQGDTPALHLGCGESYLPGYINIDLSIAERPLHQINTPDYFCNILELQFPSQSIGKIENHHMFEHFARPESLALLCAWTLWLNIGGELLIETPDFQRGIQRYLSTSSFQSKQTILRHLFGSQEAKWAYHYDGWDLEKFTYILAKLGYTLQETKQSAWKDTDNIIIRAKKTTLYSSEQLKQIAYDFLQLSCVDSSSSELLMWQGWCQDFEEAFAKMFSNP